MLKPRQRDVFNGLQFVELFGINHHRAPGKGNGATGIAGAAPSRNNGQLQFNTGADKGCHFGLCIRGQHHKRILDTPVGCVGDV